MKNAGEQIDGQLLYERQQQANKQNSTIIAPIIVAIGLRSPDNIASILRLADAAYSDRVIFVSEDMNTIEFNNKIKRISRDTDKNIHIEQYEIEDFLKIIPGLPELIAIEITTQSKDIFKTQLQDNCCFVVGSESRGIKKSILNKCKTAVHIPMYGINGSMNVSHALAISLFEWRRQKQSRIKSDNI